MSENASSFQKWLIAARLFALPASITPVIFGTVAAVTMKPVPFYPGRFAIALMAMALLHTAANMFSDVADFRSGLDRTPTPASGAIIRGLLSAEAVFGASMILFLIGGILGLWLAATVGPQLFWVGGIGILIGLGYSFFKARSLGDLAVFLDFGVLGSLGAWTAQTGGMTPAPAIWAIPIGLLVIGILHANNWRDIQSDRELEVMTFAGRLGDCGSERYFMFLTFAPYGLVTLFVLPVFARVLHLPALPYTAAIVWFSLPLALRLRGRALRRRTPRSPVEFAALDGGVAQLNLLFGVLYTLGVLAGRWI